MERLRTFLVVCVLLGLVGTAAGCGRRTAPNAGNTATAASGNRMTVALPDTASTVVFNNGDLIITNTSNETWTNVRLTLDQSYTDVLDRILPQQTATVPAVDFVRDGRSIDPSLIGHGLIFEMTCALPGNREGTCTIVWH